MPDTDALKAAWDGLQGTADQRLAAVNAMTVAGPRRDVSVAEVESYLGIRGLLTNIEDWLAGNPGQGLARTAAKELLRTIASQHVTRFEVTDAATYGALVTMLGALREAGLLTQAHVDDLLGKAETTVPWWQDKGFGSPLSHPDLIAAGIV